MLSPRPSGPGRGLWALLAGLLLLIGLSLAVGVGLGWESPTAQRMRRATPSAPPPRIRAAPPTAPGLVVEVVDEEGAPVPDARVRVAPCPDAPPGPTEAAVTDAEGVVPFGPMPGCRVLTVEHPGMDFLGPSLLPPDPRRVRSVLVHRCPGDFEVLRGAAPAEGRLLLSTSGSYPVVDGRAHAPDRRCGVARVTLLPDGPDHAWLPGGPVEIRDEGLVRVVFDETARARGGAREVDVTLVCSDCPDVLQVSGQGRCTGEGSRWRCRCTGSCVLEAWWQEVLFDWRYLKEEVARVPDGVDRVHLVLGEPGVDGWGTWHGPLPCAAVAVQAATGATRWAACDAAGVFQLADLRAGTWSLTVGWTPTGGVPDESPQQARLVVEVDPATEVDFGDLGPGDDGSVSPPPGW